MIKLYIFEIVMTLEFVMFGYILGAVWSLNISNLRKMIPIAIAVQSPLIGFIWYLVEFGLDKREKKKKAKEDRRRRKEEEKMKKQKEMERQKE